MRTDNNTHLQKVDFLRGIAIFYVFIFHCQVELFHFYDTANYNKDGIINTSATGGYWMTFSPISFGYTGVYLFLLISGFLIHLNFLKRDIDKPWHTYFSKRFWRIFPPYWVALLLFSLLFFRHGITAIKYHHLFAHFLTLHNYSDATFYTINPSFWSLAVEVQFYIIYPVLLQVRRKIGMGKTLIAMCLLSIVLLIIGTVFSNLQNHITYASSVLQLWFMWGAGAYLGELYLTKRKLTQNTNWVLWVAFFVFMIGSKYFYVTHFATIYIAAIAWSLFFDWFLNADFATLKSLPGRWMISLGLVSYSFYLLHQPLLAQFYTISSNHYQIIKKINVLVVVPIFALIIVISYLFYKFIELPSIAFGQRLRAKKAETIS